MPRRIEGDLERDAQPMGDDVRMWNSESRIWNA
jgi:hypothetical protein